MRSAVGFVNVNVITVSKKYVMQPHPRDADYEQLQYLYEHVNKINPANLDMWIAWASDGDGSPGGFATLKIAIEAIKTYPWPYY